MANEEETKEELEKPEERIKVGEVTEKPSGIRILKRGEPEVEPPLKEGEGEPGLEELPKVKLAREGKIPISRGVVKPLLRFEGMALAEQTGYSGFLYTEEDLEDIWQLIEQTGLEATPVVQVFLVLGGMHAERFGGYWMWRKAGKPPGMAMHAEGKEGA